MAKTTKTTLTATVNRATAKAVYLNLTIDGESMNLWFQNRSVTDNGDGTWTITNNALDKAVAERKAWKHTQESIDNTTAIIPAGEWGLCRNGSFYIKNRAEVYNAERSIRGELAFVKEGTESEGELYVPYRAFRRAMEDAQNRTERNIHTSCGCEVSGLRIVEA